ncbi:FMN-binding glutamate synthase family protein [Picrophilus oshimae]|uniref:Archaeal glutamate synthase [NADPH] n=1 Tax=Picrophilus torridus (strain ATCC 700027 / DSM 9790 / JCM 10055 / NBRC 100828 / KAW 2/3) TaxID=1122961 RepID=Q6KZ04_PICTO|nr:FMN-binding glutamate synthase family protein [Picrophilus oshimae]AAT44048.1 glutamate synthase [NADPH] large chain fragment II [Picrophilus oshimae DSM 9789]
MGNRNFIPVPKQKNPEFWDIKRIDHIRRLSMTGEPYEIFVNNSGNRILDRISFNVNDRTINDDYGNTETELAGLKMSVPLYLGDMSYGALSGNPNIAIANAAEKTETMAGTGEGGLLPELYDKKRIFVQWASARFGVTLDTLNRGSAVVIKIGQGAKPGIGGHLPGIKVTGPISTTRKIPEGLDAISPAPHHDIYSIEDIAQRIESLKIATKKPVFVKVAATNYIPYIAAGIARSGGDGIIIDGHGAGTGATPLVIRNNFGIPVELAVASAHKMLLKDGNRRKFKIIAAGRVSNSTDAAKLMALGADVVSMGTGVLIAMGCIMVKKCNLGFCPVALTSKIDGKRVFDESYGTDNLIRFINGFTKELSLIVKRLGLRSIRDLTGRSDLLYSDGISEKDLDILSINGEPAEVSPEYGRIDPDYSYLNHLSNTGSAYITSMGSDAPPEIKSPRRIIDFLRLDGAQVTRPPIDPYREEIDISFRLHSIDLEMPLIIDIRNAPGRIKMMLRFAAQASGIAVIDNETLEDYNDITIRYIDGIYIHRSSIYTEKTLAKGFSGYIINSEINLIKIDNYLRSINKRNEYDIIFNLNDNFLNSGDIAKLIALGADAVIISHKIFMESTTDPNYNKALNFVNAIKKELLLISGAMGMYDMQNSLTGNHEILRSVSLNYSLPEINVKEAGSQ